MGVVSEALTARVTVDDHGTVVDWNAGAERLLGYPAARILGRPAAQLLAEPIPPERLPPLAEMPRWNGTLALRHQDGHRLEVNVVAHHRTVTHPSSPGWLLLSPLADLDPLPLDEDLVVWSFAQPRCCAIALYDTGLRLRRANEIMEQAVNLTEDEMRGLRVTETVDDVASERAERSMELVLETGLPQYIENFLRTPGATREHAWSVFLSPLRGQDGKLQGVSLSAHDMTEQYWARKRLQLIAEASKRIGSTLDVTRTAHELADTAVPELADFVSVDLLTTLDDMRDPTPDALPATGPVQLRRVAHQSVTPGMLEAVVALGEVETYPESTPQAVCLRSGRATLHEITDRAISEWIKRDPLRASRVRDFGIHSLMTVPLSARGTTLGVAVFIRHQHPEIFREDDLVLAEELAARAAVCIDNARRYTRERGTAVTLQRSLLPQRLPEQQAVEVASRYLPAGTHAGVGGDWFDVIPLSGARVALVVGDVVGHGLHASATMGRLRTAVRTLADLDLPPDELLTHLDDLVVRLNTEGKPGEETGADMGATCLCAVYDPVSRRCSLARAGHPLPAWRHAEGPRRRQLRSQPRLAPAARPAGLDQRRRSRPPGPAGARSRRRDRCRRDPPRRPLHRRADAARLHRPGQPLGVVEHRPGRSADGPAPPHEIQLRPLEVQGPVTGDRNRAQALRHDRRRQRVQLVHQRRPGHPLERRRPEPAQDHPGVRVRSGADRVGGQALGTSFVGRGGGCVVCGLARAEQQPREPDAEAEQRVAHRDLRGAEGKELIGEVERHLDDEPQQEAEAPHQGREQETAGDRPGGALGQGPPVGERRWTRCRRLHPAA